MSESQLKLRNRDVWGLVVRVKYSKDKDELFVPNEGIARKILKIIKKEYNLE